ncbi:MAG TPA: MipA/OmpV family protein [Burkholderiales bacterium]
MRAAWLCLAAACAASAVRAEELAQWELGAGAIALSLPDYRGSDERHGYVYPIPYVVYRDQRLRLDRQGLRAVLFEGARVEFNLSVSVTPPVDSDKNRARQGMPHLDPTVEIGPQANVTLWRDSSTEQRLDFRLPLRAVIATDLSDAQGTGYVVHPHLYFGTRPRFLGGAWNLGLQAGPLYATDKYHQYYYGVDARFATPQRPAYDAHGGYSGAMALAALSRKVDRIWIGAFLRYDTLSGATFSNSPLVRRDQSVMVGIGIAYVFATSDQKVEATE